jgi:hypothetical protein
VCAYLYFPSIYLLDITFLPSIDGRYFATTTNMNTKRQEEFQVIKNDTWIFFYEFRKTDERSEMRI